jgi:5'-nucleotidase
MNILLTNDDGIFSEGLLALANVLVDKNHKVFIFAPDGNRSGASRSASFYKEFSVNKVKVQNYDGYSLSGTPADCVRFGLHYAPCKIDVVCAGINHGANLGTDCYYSGTVNACLEGVTAKVKSIAFSNTAFSEHKFSETTKIISKYFDHFINLASTEYTLNVNIPNVNFGEETGVVFTGLGVNRYSDTYEKTGENTYRLIGDMLQPTEEDKYTDVYYSTLNYVTVSPVVHISTTTELVNKYKDYKF